MIALLFTLLVIGAGIGYLLRWTGVAGCIAATLVATLLNQVLLGDLVGGVTFGLGGVLLVLPSFMITLEVKS